MTLRARYGWVENFWSEVVAERRERRWQVAVLRDGDLHVRDGIALARLREALRERHDIVYRFVRAWEGDPVPGARAPGTDKLLLGRGKPFLASGLSVFASCLERKAVGRFLDPSNGQTGNSIQYANRLFSRRPLEEQALYRRCDVDYGVLLFRTDEVAGETRRLLSIGGLGLLGTLGLTVLLTDGAHRGLLKKQAQAMAPWGRSHRPEQLVELCVRIQVDGDEGLASLLDQLESGGKLPFSYQLEAVAVAVASGERAVHFRAPQSLELEFIKDATGRSGGWVRVGGTGGSVHLPRARFGLLHQLLEHPEGMTIRELCLAHGSHDPADPGEPSKAAIEAMHKLIHDTRKDASAKLFPGARRRDLIRYERKRGRYVLRHPGD